MTWIPEQESQRFNQTVKRIGVADKKPGAWSMDASTLFGHSPERKGEAHATTETRSNILSIGQNGRPSTAGEIRIFGDD
jgi:hypothetical protein